MQDRSIASSLVFGVSQFRYPMSLTMNDTLCYDKDTYLYLVSTVLYTCLYIVSTVLQPRDTAGMLGGMTTVQSNLFRLIAQLEAKTGKPYPLQTIAAKSGVHRHTVEVLVSGKPQGVQFKTIAGLVDFFASEGMPVTLNDLFTVTN